tara:strand:+ start:7747 stop:8322 length:576 start_codon:yes stop_codon:yes gene_type:complete
MIDVIAVHQAPANLAKTNSMAELKSLFTEITGLEKVPSFSDKLAAAKRIFKEYAKAPKHPAPEPVVTHVAEIPEQPTGKVLFNDGDDMADVPPPCTDDSLPDPPPVKLKAKDRTYTFNVSGGSLNDAKIPGQMMVILGEFMDDTDDYSEVALQAVILKIAADGILITKQPAWRIFQYYRPRMIKLGFLSVS